MAKVKTRREMISAVKVVDKSDFKPDFMYKVGNDS